MYGCKGKNNLTQDFGTFIQCKKNIQKDENNQFLNFCNNLTKSDVEILKFL